MVTATKLDEMGQLEERGGKGNGMKWGRSEDRWKGRRDEMGQVGKEVERETGMKWGRSEK
jgi:hypothetical protein